MPEAFGNWEVAWFICSISTLFDNSNEIHIEATEPHCVALRASRHGRPQACKFGKIKN